MNGHLAHWAAEHLPTFIAAAGAIRQALPLVEWFKIAVVAMVTAVITSQVTLARLDERIKSIHSEREILVRKRDEQIAEIKRQVERIERAITALQIQFAGRRK